MTYSVSFNDIEDHYPRAQWAKENCISFCYAEMIDISDFSMISDTMHEFVFELESDAIWFKLRWS